MAETTLIVSSSGIIGVRLDVTEINGQGPPFRLGLLLPLKLNLPPLKAQWGPANYVLLRLAGKVHMQGGVEVGEFEAPPLAEDSRDDTFFRLIQVQAPLDYLRIKQIEDARAGADVQLAVDFSGLLWMAQPPSFSRTYSQTRLDVRIPRSHWADSVLNRWGVTNVKVVEVYFPGAQAGERYRNAWSHIENAERHFANGQYSQTLAELYAGFESLAKSAEFTRPDQQFFAAEFSNAHPQKREALKLAMDHFCDLLHLGRHEAKESPDTFNLSRSDARFVLTMSEAIFEYLTSKT